jgi:hypothetical protein
VIEIKTHKSAENNNGKGVMAVIPNSFEYKHPRKASGISEP